MGTGSWARQGAAVTLLTVWGCGGGGVQRTIRELSSPPATAPLPPVSGSVATASPVSPSASSAPAPSVAAEMPAPPAAARPIVLYPGDQLRIIVLGQEALSFPLKVPSNGVFTFPLIGTVRLAGRSVEEVEQEVSRRLEQDYLVDPQVSLFVEAYTKKYVYVLGAVKDAKEFELPEGQAVTLTRVLAKAGGFTPDAAKDRVRLIRDGGAGGPLVREIDVTAITEGGQAALDPTVEPGDVVVVAQLKKIYVLGEVKKPSGLDVASDRRITVTQAISEAGGFTLVADERRVRILRRRADGRQETIVVDVWSVINGGQQENDLWLEPGDIVFVPESIV